MLAYRSVSVGLSHVVSILSPYSMCVCVTSLLVLGEGGGYTPNLVDIAPK